MAPIGTGDQVKTRAKPQKLGKVITAVKKHTWLVEFEDDDGEKYQKTYSSKQLSKVSPEPTKKAAMVVSSDGSRSSNQSTFQASSVATHKLGQNCEINEKDNRPRRRGCSALVEQTDRKGLTVWKVCGKKTHWCCKHPVCAARVTNPNGKLCYGTFLCQQCLPMHLLEIDGKHPGMPSNK